MDDSDQDFVDLCSKLLKRVRRKGGDPVGSQKNREHQPPSQASAADKRKRKNKKDGVAGHKNAEPKQPVVSGGTGPSLGDAGPSVSAAGERAERGLAAKDKVLHRMQEFKRVGPQRMVHRDESPITEEENVLPQRREPPGPQSEPQDRDEVLALQLQQQLDREAAEAQVVDLEEGGLFFCQLCHKDLSHMTPDGRTQHLNRCLDESEDSAPAPPPPPPPPGVPDCPICGKRFKSPKSRAAHLKRCSSDMGVAPAVLLQVLHRQAAEDQSAPAANQAVQTGRGKRKGPSEPCLPARKRPRKKTPPLDEDTMVALALSSSLLEQQREKEADVELEREISASNASMTHALMWKRDAGRGRGKRKKGTVPRPPPLLLVQDAEVALRRLQERVSVLLLRGRPPSPPTPEHSPSRLPSWTGAAPLWQKSALQEGWPACPSDFYTPELREYITPQELATPDVPSSSTTTTANQPDTSIHPVKEGAAAPVTKSSILPSSSQAALSSSTPSTPGTEQLPVSSQVLRDLMELAEDGMTLTQCGYTAFDPAKDKQSSAGPLSDLHLSGFVAEEPEQRAELRLSGFLPEAARAHGVDSHARNPSRRPEADQERDGHRLAALSRLTSDLSSMVNNPQLSDLQLQVDSGEVYFAHSFMAYARCPLLAQMVHESGFGVQEDGAPAAQRVLMNDVPGRAVLALLQYLYTARCSISASLQPHVLELASRFDLEELQQLCQLHQEETADFVDQEQDGVTDQAFMELLRSMWNEDDEETDPDGGKCGEGGSEEDGQADDLASGDREVCEERVNEEELEEIYEFAATQRKREEEQDSTEEDEKEKLDEKEDGDLEIEADQSFNKPTVRETQRRSTGLQPDLSLDRSYSRLFSETWGLYEEEDPSTSSPPKTHNPQSQHHLSPHDPSSTDAWGGKRSGRTLLQSSASIVDEPPGSHIPCTSALPVPGLSPAKASDWVSSEDEGTAGTEKGLLPVCVLLSPASPQQSSREPELIVLSDSSEEMNVDLTVLSSRSPSPRSHSSLRPHKDRISPDSPSAARPRSSVDLSPAGCSPEVSWLIPSTPVQPGSRTSSTQTNSSMRRMQLFPKASSSSLSSSIAFSSPSFTDKLQTSDNPAGVSARIAPTDACVPPLKADKRIRSSAEVPSSSGMIEDREVESIAFAVPPSHLKHLKHSRSSHLLPPSDASTLDTPVHTKSHPYSSTPLHTEMPKPPVPLTSPLHGEPDGQGSIGQRREREFSESPEKMALGSLCLSLSQPSHSPSSSSDRGPRISQNLCKFSLHSGSSVESESKLTKRLAGEEAGTSDEKAQEAEGTGDDDERDDSAKGELEEGEATDSSLRRSFAALDEPPIAFNDSWGLDGCVDLQDNQGVCFSLRLEDSRDSSQKERQGQTAAASSSLSSSSSTSFQPRTASPPLIDTHAGPSPPPVAAARATPQISNSLLDSRLWDSWGEEEEGGEALPLTQRLNPSAQIQTPVSSGSKRRVSLVPITPMPQYSDMDTPELKNKLNRFGVRPLPKRQMILKLKEIHQYTHQLVSSEDEAPQENPPGSTAAAAVAAGPPGSGTTSCAPALKFKQPAVISPAKRSTEDAEPLSASQGSNASSTAASEDSERSNPELCPASSDSDSDSGVSASQAPSRLQDRLRAVRSFILSDSALYGQILQYRPLVLSQLQQRLKAAGIRLGAAKLVDYLDSQCITFTTAKPGRAAPNRRRGKRTGKVAKGGGEEGVAVRRKGVAKTTMQ